MCACECIELLGRCVWQASPPEYATDVGGSGSAGHSRRASAGSGEEWASLCHTSGVATGAVSGPADMWTMGAWLFKAYHGRFPLLLPMRETAEVRKMGP